MFEFLKKMKFKIKYYLLKRKLIRYIDSGKLIHVDREDRGIGKTYALAEIAKKYNIPILVFNKAQADVLNRKYNTHMFHGGKNVLEFRGSGLDNGVLIDEGFNEDEIKDIYYAGINIRTGFYYANYLVK